MCRLAHLRQGCVLAWHPQLASQKQLTSVRRIDRLNLWAELPLIWVQAHCVRITSRVDQNLAMLSDKEWEEVRYGLVEAGLFSDFEGNQQEMLQIHSEGVRR